MNCKMIQELIITDYVDGEAGHDLRREVEAHLGSCSTCRQFEKAVREVAVKPFKGMPREEAPAYIWNRVKEEISLQKSPALTEKVLEALHGFASAILRIPRPALAFAAAAAIIVAIVLARMPSTNNSLDSYLAEEAEFIASLDLDEGNGFGLTQLDAGNGIENML
jgi:anti-sigma factor RsiW